MAAYISVRESTVVKPAVETPQMSLWISNADKVMPNTHSPIIFFYKPNNHAGVEKDKNHHFFDMHVLKGSLSKALVPFHPLAGRLKQTRDVGESGLTETKIDCNAQGVVFVVAESNSCITDYGDFAPFQEFGSGLIPDVDYSGGISSFPLLLVQITYLKCGGVALGLRLHHYVLDGVSAFQFTKTWSEMARGLNRTIAPTMDRTILCARNPPRPLLHNNHDIEYPPRHQHQTTGATVVSVVRFTREQIQVLKATTNKEEVNDHNVTNRYSSFVVIAAHVWRCACKARELANDQETTLYLTVNGRPRLQPPLPPSHFGNVVFRAAATALVGDLISKPISYAASCVHKALVRMDDEYLRSTIDYFELVQRHQKLSNLAHGGHVKCPNLGINNWSALSVYDSDFGWGRPIFVGRSTIRSEGKAYMVPSANNDGSLSMSISLQSQHMKSFSNLVYEGLITSCL